MVTSFTCDSGSAKGLHLEAGEGRAQHLVSSVGGLHVDAQGLQGDAI